MSGPQTIARAGLIVSGAFLVSRILGFVRVFVIAGAFGSTPELDAFFAAFRLPDLIFQLVAAGALTSALIPIVTGLFTTNEMPRAWRVVSTVVNLMLIGLAVLATTLFIMAPVIVPRITPGFGPAQLDQTIELTRIMLLSPVFLALGSVATSVLNAGNRFTAAAIAPIAYNLAIIGAAILLGPTFGVEGLALGVVAGSLCHLLVQLRPLLAMGFRYQRKIEGDDPEARHALVLMAPRAIGLGATQITFIVVTSLATMLGAGAVSDFNFAFVMLQIPLGIIGVPLGIVVMPTLSREAALGNEAGFAALLTRALRLLIYVMVPMSVVAVVVRQPFVEVLFGGGKVSQDDLDVIAFTFAWFLIGLTAHALIAVLARAFYARQDTVTPVVWAVAAVGINTTLAVILVGPLGLGGLALAIAVAAWVEAIALIVVLRRRLPSFPLAGMGRVALEAIGASLVAGGAAYVVLGAISSSLGGDPGRLILLVEVSVVGVSFGLVYAGVSLALRIPELPTIVGVMVDVLRRPARA